jgi:hypothetical protein
MKKEVIIQSVIDKIGATTYLEIGVQRGKNFFAIRAPRKIAVDPNFMFGITRRLMNLGQVFRHTFSEMTSDAFFQTQAATKLPQGIDVAFIDGLHTYEQSLLDFQYCYKHLRPGGVIMFHDCNPLTEEAGVKAFSPADAVQKTGKPVTIWNGDVWKTIVHLRALHPELKVFTLDCDQGVGVACKGTPESTLPFKASEIDAIPYATFAAKRQDMLNLKAPAYLQEFLNTLAPMREHATGA